MIGTLARARSAQGAEVFIVSGDEDLFQLVNDRVRVLKPSRGASDGETLCDAEKVKEIIGVEPAQVVDWLALTGDPSDNIPGARPLPGHEPPLAEGEKKRSYIGPKGATELIQQFGTLEKALENYEQVKKQSYRDALRDFRKEALLSRELATIRTDVPVEVALTNSSVRPLDFTELTALCQELGFTSLLREFLEEAPAPAEAAVEVGGTCARRNPSSDGCSGLEQRAPWPWRWGWKATKVLPGRLDGLGLSDGKRLATVALGDTADLLPALAAGSRDRSRPKAVHNSKLLQLLLAKQGIALAGVADDTMLYSYLLEPLASSHALADVVLRRQGPQDFSLPGRRRRRARTN